MAASQEASGTDGSTAKPVDGWLPRKAASRHAASGPALRSTNSLTPGLSPSGMADMAGDRQVSWLTGHRGHHLPGHNDPVVFGAGFPLTVAGAAPASLQTREPTPCLSRPVFPLSPVRRPDTVGSGDSIGRKRRQVNPLRRRAGYCREGVPVILSPPRDPCRRTSWARSTPTRPRGIAPRWPSASRSKTPRLRRRPSRKVCLMVNTGTGKGKSTAAFGLALRALGHGWRVGVVQFIKGRATGERRPRWNRSAIACLAYRRRGLHLGDAGQGARHRRLPPRLGGSRA